MLRQCEETLRLRAVKLKCFFALLKEANVSSTSMVKQQKIMGHVSVVLSVIVGQCY